MFFPPTNIETKKALTSQYNGHQLPEDGIIRNFRIIIPIQYTALKIDSVYLSCTVTPVTGPIRQEMCGSIYRESSER